MTEENHDLDRLWQLTLNARLDIGRPAFIDNYRVRCTRAAALRRYAPFVVEACDLSRDRLRALVAAASSNNEYRQRDHEVAQEMAELADDALGLVEGRWHWRDLVAWARAQEPA